MFWIEVVILGFVTSAAFTLGLFTMLLLNSILSRWLDN